MSKLVEFKSSLPSCIYALRDGTQAVFMFGRYRTDNPVYIEELKKEVALRHPHISGGEEIDPAVDNPLAGLEAKFRAKFLAELAASQAAALDKSNDAGGNHDINQNFGALTSDSALLSVGSDETKVGVTDTSKSIPVVPVSSNKAAMPNLKLK